MTTENNKIIAEFMEWKVVNDELLDHKGLFVQYSDEPLKFHSDWNWLMEVVEKIESLGYGMDIQTLGVHVNTFEGTKFRYNRLFLCEKSKIEAVYNACLEFIKYTINLLFS